MSEWEKDFWAAHETDSEHAERVEAAKLTAGSYFDNATYTQRQTFADTMNFLAPLRGPRAERQRADALRKFRAETAEAAVLFDKTCIALMQEGEVSEDLSNEWDSLCKPVALAAAE